MDIRWKQRFSNYEKALNLLASALAVKHPDIIQRGGTIQFFEMSFELAWKTLKDYLEAAGYREIRAPRDVLKKAFEDEIISDGHLWMKALDDRNLTTHTYDEATAIKIEALIRHHYYPLLKDLYAYLLDKIHDA